MTKLQNRLMAWDDGFFMRRNKYVFSTIIDIGASSCPEYWSWQELFPDKPVFGIEPRYPKPGYWNGPYLQAALGSRIIKEKTYCWRCWTTDCKMPKRHHWRRVPMTTLDQAVQDFSVPGPYYIWMDIDGAEVDILTGAPEVLKQTAWLHTEVLDDSRGVALVAWLKEAGYVLIYRYSRGGPNAISEDHLYFKSLP